MCGRYVARADSAVERYWSLIAPWPHAFLSYNVAPGQSVPVIVRDEPFGLAGLWDRSVTSDGDAVESCTVITVAANPLVAQIHANKRMPVIVTAVTAEAWLEGSREDAEALLVPYPSETMRAYPVSRRVNSPRNDGPELISRQDTPARS